MKERIINLDLLRLLGILLIIVAHSNPPGWLFQLRNFDVPLLIIASAMTYRAVYENKKIDIFLFYKKRVSRLILPVWIFLSAFFLFTYVVNKLNGQAFAFSLKDVIESYFLINGIGFVWIFKVFLIFAIVTPFSLYLYKKYLSIRRYYFSLALCYFGYEVFLNLTRDFINKSDVVSYLFNNVFFIVIPYVLVYLYGFRLRDIKVRYILFLQVVLFSIFIILGLYHYKVSGGIISTQHYKYPATIYYLSYAVFMANNAFILFRNVKLPIFVEKGVVWLSSNSLWFYLWHIVAYYLWQQYFPNDYIGFSYFVYKAAFLFGFGCFMVHIQIKFLKIVKSKYDNTNPYYKILMDALS
jgi:peptidoglycan/LPS O-acetylase OafA/YrhL